MGAARRRSRGHGPARLDGTRPRATVADKVMKSGKTAGHGNGHPSVPNRTQAKRAGPKLEAGPQASAERSEGTMEARQGRDAAGGSMRNAHDSATGHLPGAGDAQPSKPKKPQDQDESTQGIVDLLRMQPGRSGTAWSAVFRGAKPARWG